MTDSQDNLTDSPDPDLAILLSAAYGALINELRSAHLAVGLEVRPAFGYVIRAVAAEEPTINRLAELLDVTKQSASQLADEVERAGFIERFEDPVDRRRRRLRLTELGRSVRQTSLRTSAALERDLVAELGPEAVGGCRATLLALSARAGALDDVLARRARLV
jgi:DNA-binding MarR family transcriptional regulator